MPEIDPAERESEASGRIEDIIKSPYDLEDDSWQGFIQAGAGEVNDAEETLSEIVAAKTVVDASGAQLDRLGRLVQVPRQPDERDALYRLRLQIAFRRRIGSPTVPELRDLVAVVLGTSSEDIELRPGESRAAFGVEEGAATVNIGIEQAILDDVEFSTDEVLDALGRSLAAGVRLDEVFAVGTFRFSEGTEAVVSEHGFAELDDDAEDGEATKEDIVEGTGGTWSTFIQ